MLLNAYCYKEVTFRYSLYVTTFLLDHRTAVLPDVRHPQLIAEMNIAIRGIQAWGWVGYEVLWRGFYFVLISL